MAFEKLKKAMTTAPVLAMPNFSREFILETDASVRARGSAYAGRTSGCVLQQDAWAKSSRKIHLRKGTMAISLAVEKWRHYLMGCHFVIYSEQQSLRFITQQRKVGGDYQRWMRKLIGFGFEVEYRP